MAKRKKAAEVPQYVQLPPTTATKADLERVRNEMHCLHKGHWWRPEGRGTMDLREVDLLYTPVFVQRICRRCRRLQSRYFDLDTRKGRRALKAFLAGK